MTCANGKLVFPLAHARTKYEHPIFVQKLYNWKKLYNWIFINVTLINIKFPYLL
jgi:hypothetical protein